MYRLQIVSAQGARELKWDPHKLQEKDPETVAAVAEADRILREVLAQNQAAWKKAVLESDRHDGEPQRLAVYGRWLH